MYPIVVGDNARDILGAASDLATLIGVFVAIGAYFNWRREHSNAEKHKRLFDLEVMLDESFVALHSYANAVYLFGMKKINGKDSSAEFNDLELKRIVYFEASTKYRSALGRVKLFLSEVEASAFVWTFEKIEGMYDEINRGLYLSASKVRPGESGDSSMGLYDMFTSARVAAGGSDGPESS
jgi:hypothetical protein